MHSRLIKIAEEFNVTVYMTNQGNFTPNVAVFVISLNFLEVQTSFDMFFLLCFCLSHFLSYDSCGIISFFCYALFVFLGTVFVPSVRRDKFDHLILYSNEWIHI